MNIFTHKDIGVLPFQMIKLAFGSGAKQTAEAVTNLATNVVQGFKNTNKAVQGVGDGVTNLQKSLDALGKGGQATEAQLKNITNNLDALETAIKNGDARAAAQYDELMKQYGQVMKSLPGRWGRIGAGTALAGTTAGLTLAGDRLLTRAANKAHAAGKDAAKEGELAEKQNGSRWDNTWNAIDKFREENPGLFYGGLGVGLLGGGYALSEMLDDDDDEEDEYSR